MARTDTRKGRQQRLKAVPPTELVDDEAVLDQRPVRQRRQFRCGHADPSFGEEATGDGSITKEAHPVGRGEVGHRAGRAAVENGVLHLVRRHRYARVNDLAEARRVEVRRPHQTDLSGLAQVVEDHRRRHVARHRVVPPVELDDVDAVHAEAC